LCAGSVDFRFTAGVLRSETLVIRSRLFQPLACRGRSRYQRLLALALQRGALNVRIFSA
jgi:hypothetical protein